MSMRKRVEFAGGGNPIHSSCIEKTVENGDTLLKEQKSSRAGLGHEGSWLVVDKSKLSAGASPGFFDVSRVGRGYPRLEDGNTVATSRSQAFNIEELNSLRKSDEGMAFW